MIGKLKGIVDYISEDHLLLDVQGVGYLVHTIPRLLSQLEIKQNLSIFTELVVKEDSHTLFGFISPHEKACFKKLVTVKGVGPKMAMNILHHLPPGELVTTLSFGDNSAFGPVSGVGPKLANRIISELKDKLSSLSENFSVSASNPGNAAPKTITSEVGQDAIMALTNLGINKNEAVNLVAKVLKLQPEVSLDNLIKTALQKSAQNK